MALIKCSKCAAEISDKAACCPKCGAPVILHKWRCPKCGNMISEEPCPHCSGKSIAVTAKNISSDGTAAAVPDFVAKNKRNLRILIFALLVVAVIIFAIIASQSGNGGSGSKVKHGTYFDYYDDDGDGWVDRMYSREFDQWNNSFQPGILSMDEAE